VEGHKNSPPPLPPLSPKKMSRGTADGRNVGVCNQFRHQLLQRLLKSSNMNLRNKNDLRMMTKRHFLDTLYGVLKDCNVFMIGDSSIVVDTGGDITIKERVFKESKGLWELLTRKKLST